MPLLAISAVNPKPEDPPGYVGVKTEVFVSSALLIVLVAGAALIKWFLSRTVDQIEDRFKTVEARIEKGDLTHKEVLSRIEVLQRDLLANYVPHEDWVRATATNDAKLDSLHRRLDQVVMILLKRRGGEIELN